jgi:serine/threonine-protein kinase
MIGDTFKVLSFIGAGGMSNVYKCEDLSIGRIIAVKTLQAGFSKEALRRFQTEGKAIAKLEHPNVLKLYGLQVLPDGLPILVMEFVTTSPSYRRTNW